MWFRLVVSRLPLTSGNLVTVREVPPLLAASRVRSPPCSVRAGGGISRRWRSSPSSRKATLMARSPNSPPSNCETARSAARLLEKEMRAWSRSSSQFSTTPTMLKAFTRSERLSFMPSIPKTDTVLGGSRVEAPVLRSLSLPLDAGTLAELPAALPATTPLLPRTSSPLRLPPLPRKS